MKRINAVTLAGRVTRKPKKDDVDASLVLTVTSDTCTIVVTILAAVVPTLHVPLVVGTEVMVHGYLFTCTRTNLTTGRSSGKNVLVADQIAVIQPVIAQPGSEPSVPHTRDALAELGPVPF